MGMCKILTSIVDVVQEKVAVGSIEIGGWVRTRRGSKKFSFLEVNDGTTAKSLQVVCDAALPNYASEIEKITTGCSVRISGQLVESQGKGQKFELQASAVEVVGWADPESFPLQKKEMSFEYLREVAHMRPRTATFSSIFRIRSVVSHAIHRFFEESGFNYIHSPILTTNDGEGAGETFKVTNLSLPTPAAIPLVKDGKGKTDFSQDFFGKETMLCVTGQLEAELLAMGLSKVYTFGPTFRAENSNTSRHLAEFWMIEPEMAFWDLEDTMELGQNLIRYVVKAVFEKCADDLEVLSTRAEVDSREVLKMALENPFVRVTYTEAVEILQRCAQKFENSVNWGDDLKSEHERYLCEQHFKAPTIVYNYPADLKAFYMYLNDDGKTVRAMDLLMPGIGEVIGGSQREDREDVLCARMKEKGIDATHLQWYADLRKFGGVPHSGFGLGLERLLVWITGMGNVRDVIPFPRVPGSCEF